MIAFWWHRDRVSREDISSFAVLIVTVGGKVLSENSEEYATLIDPRYNSGQC